MSVSGETVRAALDQVFDALPQVRRYVLDDQHALRRHMTVFVDGRQVQDRTSLSDAVTPESEIYIMQALSGGR